jgi:hypothetical protein
MGPCTTNRVDDNLHLGLGMLELWWMCINFTTIALKNAWTKSLDQLNAS